MHKEGFVAIEIGGTHTRTAYSESLEQITLSDKKSFPTTNEYQQDLQSIVQSIDEKQLTKINSIGVSLPGMMDSQKQMLVYAKNLQGFIGQSLKDDLAYIFSTQVRFESDTVAAATGEASVAKNTKDFSYITWGTGIGGAAVTYQDGEPIVTRLAWKKYFSSWEDHCGGKQIEKQYKKSADNLTPQEWDEVMESFTSETVLFSQKTKTEKIIFGGGASLKQTQRIESIKDTFPKTMKKHPVIEIAKLGEDAGLIGTLHLLQ